jgi:phosphohistidine phosphatase SixA
MYALVRHAHAGDKKLWAGPETERPLSLRGQQQAVGIASNLESMPVTRLISSPYLRCVQSLRPLSTRLGSPIQISDALGPDGTVAGLDRLLDDPQIEGAVICTHGEQLKALLKRWEHHATLLVPDSPYGASGQHSTEKGAAWIVETDPPGHTIYYLRPVEVGPSLGPAADSWVEAGVS